jgi:hypothetical protein
MTKEDREIWAQESRMREHESACEILSPLPTLAMLGKCCAQFLVPSPPTQPASPMMSRP